MHPYLGCYGIVSFVERRTEVDNLFNPFLFENGLLDQHVHPTLRHLMPQDFLPIRNSVGGVMKPLTSESEELDLNLLSHLLLWSGRDRAFSIDEQTVVVCGDVHK